MNIMPMQFIDKFSFHWEHDFYMTHGAKILLAVSGGPDSMALLHLFHTLQIPCVVAHVNYGLRGEESNAEEALVCETCKKLDKPFHVLHPDMQSQMATRKKGVQETAREIRYDWFHQLAIEHQCEFIATAHHANDSIETFFLNLSRGTGLDGLTGIKSKHGNIIRPLYFSFREEIESYLQQNSIPFAIDSSNETDAYTRNLIRHQIIPVFRKINPSFDQRMLENMNILSAANSMYHQSLQRLKNELVHLDAEQSAWKLSMLEIAGRGIIDAVFYELIKDFDFTPSQATDMMDAIGGKTGLIFYSPTHTCITDRGFFLIREITDVDVKHNEFEMINSSDGENKLFRWQMIINKDFELPYDSAVGCMDADKIQWPVKLRRWEAGDVIQPMGMKGKKKISDWATDKKMNLFNKSEIYVLESGKQLIWASGLGIAEKVKVTSDTTRIFMINKK